MKNALPRTSLALSIVVALTLAISTLTGAHVANGAGPAPVGLGTAASFALLAGTPAVTNTGATTVTGDLGIAPAAAVTGFPPGVVNGTIHAADAVALQAKNDLATAYVDAAGRPALTVVTGGALGGRTLVGGVYNAGGATLGLTGTLTLDGQNDASSVWIFQATSDLITASSSSVNLINGAQPCNVYWQVTSSATLGSTSTFAGTILALTSITMNNGVSLNGRALARNGAVTLINDTITRSVCAAAPAATPSATPAPSGAATPAAPGAVTPAATPTPVPAISHLPSTATVEDSGQYLILPLLVIAFAVLYLVARATRRRRQPAP